MNIKYRILTRSR